MKRSFVLSAFLLTTGGLVPGLFADPGTGILFGTDANGGAFITVNPGTGAGALVAFMGIGPTPALATDPTTGIIYAGRGSGLPELYTVTPAGIAGFVGNTGLGFAAVGGMDFRADGTLFAAVNIAGDGGTGSDHLATLNKANGQATIIGPFGNCVGVPPIPVGGAGSCTIEGIEAIAFDAAGNLWGAKSARGSAGAPGLYSINPANGAAAFVAILFSAVGRPPPSGGVVSLQFACDGALYGGTARGFGAADGGFLVTINPLTGQFSFVGGASATGGSSLGALAFELSCNQPPVCSAATASTDTLSPPNHKFKPITVAGVTDPDGDPVAITIDSIFQDEEVTELGIGSGNTTPDGLGVGTDTASVRAERNGNRNTPGNGRVYHIGFTADDGNGGTCSDTVTVCVPHDQSPVPTCVDEGPLFDSTVP